MSNEFRGGIFHPELPGGRCGATITVSRDRVHAWNNENQEWTIFSGNLEVEMGGSDNHLVLMHSKKQPGLVIYTQDESIFTALDLVDSKDVKAALHDIRKGPSKKKKGCAGLLVFFFGMFATAGYGIASMVRLFS